MGVLRKCFQDFWTPSGWSGRSRMSKNWGFGGFWCLDGVFAIVPPHMILFGIIGTMGVLRKYFQDFWTPAGWSGRSRMSKNWGFGGFWVSWWSFCHCTPTYDTFLESLEAWEYSGSVSRTFRHQQDDQDGQKCPKTGVLALCSHLYVLGSVLDGLGSLLMFLASFLMILSAYLMCLTTLLLLLKAFLKKARKVVATSFCENIPNFCHFCPYYLMGFWEWCFIVCPSLPPDK